MSVNNTLAERGSRYGQFADHAKIAQGVQDVMRNAPNWNNLDYDMKQALTTIADKIGRILNGDPFYIDNWHDIQGYALLIENRLNMLETPKQEIYEQPSLELFVAKVNTIFTDSGHTYNKTENISSKTYDKHHGH